MDISIGPLSENDLEIADSMVRSAFDLSESQLTEICRYFALQPDWWLLTTLQDESARVIGAINFGPFTYLGMMAVRKDFQRKGIGKALLQHMLNWTQQQGISLLRLATSEAGFPLYARFGFSVFDQALLFQLTDHSHLSNYSQHFYLLRIDDIQVLVDFDTPIFGASRAAIFRVLLTDFADRAFAVYDKSGHMDGYLFAQLQRLGPWAARSPQDAETLLQAGLTLPYDEPPLAIASKLNLAAADLLKRFDFQLKLSNHHMLQGGSTLPDQRNLIYGHTNFGIG